ncbi:MAG: hypothetical protein J2P36_12250 [Ktedonobacteraceae bacterium]|nr:hypothetical protein [Ktedonobacteraceae bacterium]
MTPEQIRQRNYAILATVNHDPPFHEQALDFLKMSWRIVGPIAFIVFTAGEVYYYLKHFMPGSDNAWTEVLLWGITLLIEIPFCIATYDLSARKKRAVEAKAEGREAPDKDTPGAIAMWTGMALVNVTGQVAFMILVTNVANQAIASATPIYFFITMRVLGVLLGDAYTAFFLLPPENTISRVLKIQKAQATGFKVLAESAAEQQTIEQRSSIDLRRNQLALKREEREADFMHEFSEMNMRAALRNQRRLLEAQETPLELESGEQEDPEQPNTGDL